MAYQQYGNTGYQYQQNPDGSYSVINPLGNQLTPQLAQQYVNLAQQGYTPYGETGQFTRTNPDGSASIQSVLMPGQQMNVANPGFSPTAWASGTGSGGWGSAAGPNAMQQALGMFTPGAYQGSMSLSNPNGSMQLQGANASSYGWNPATGLGPALTALQPQSNMGNSSLQPPMPRQTAPFMSQANAGLGALGASAFAPQQQQQGSWNSATGLGPAATAMPAWGQSYGGAPYSNIGSMPGSNPAPYSMYGGYSGYGGSPAPYTGGGGMGSSTYGPTSFGGGSSLGTY